MRTSHRIQWLAIFSISNLILRVSSFIDLQGHIIHNHPFVNAPHQGLHHVAAVVRQRRTPFITLKDSSSYYASYEPDSNDNFVDELSEERRTNLFQCLLRDLQIEGVPLLGCDADQVHTLQAALWTTMAEVVDQDAEQRVCMIFETIPMNDLRIFVEDFCVLKLQRRLMDHLPELDRLTLSLVGKGAGPAVLIEVSALSHENIDKSQKWKDDGLAEFKTMAAMNAFVDRMVIGLEACPHISNFNGGSVNYRYSSATDICNALSSFWNCICQLAAIPIAATSKADHDRFAAVAEVISRSLCLYRGDSVYELLHFHPTYERNRIHHTDSPAHGHLPPQSWLRPMLRLHGHMDAAEQLSEDELALSDFQRRSPHTAVCIKRVSLLDSVTDAASGIVDLDLGNGVKVKVSGVPSYCRNVIRLAEEGKERLEAALQLEVEISE